MVRYAVIMAGGVGERLWPLSRRHRPKQFLALGKTSSLIRQTVERLLLVMPATQIWIITSSMLRARMVEAVSDLLPVENVYAEPAKRNTAGCIAFAYALAKVRQQGETASSMGVFPADHYIHPPETFAQVVERAFKQVETDPVIATIGITPRYPATGYGYIEVASVPKAGETVPVKAFREKPDRKTAEMFVQQNRFFWNSGMFFWSLTTLEHAFQHYAPDIARWLPALVSAIQRSDLSLVEIFRQLPDISIDYAVMEKARNLVMLPATFQWSDIGSLAALEEVFSKDSAGNVAIGHSIYSLETTGTIVWKDGEQSVVLYGIQDLVVVVMEDVVFVCPKEYAQQVREVVRFLKQNGREDLLE